ICRRQNLRQGCRESQSLSPSLVWLPPATSAGYPRYRKLQESWSTRCLSLGKFLANIRLLSEVFDFLLQVPSTARIRSSLNYRVITDLAVADSVRDLVMMLR